MEEKYRGTMYNALQGRSCFLAIGSAVCCWTPAVNISGWDQLQRVVCQGFGPGAACRV